MIPALAQAAPGRGLPLHDWQFWVVTLICAAAAWLVGRRVFAALRRRPRGVRAPLTIAGKPLERR